MVKIFKNVKRLKLKIASIIMLLVLFTLEFSPFAVKAAPQQLQFYCPGSISVARDVAYGKNVWYSRATLGGEVAYCVDYTCTAPSGVMTFRKYLSDQGMAVLIHGYPNCTPESIGCLSEDEAYMATQMALWEVLNRTGESNKAGIPFRVDNIQPLAGKEDFYNRAVTAAAKLVAMAEADPYTSVPTMVIDNANVKLNYIDGDALIGPYTVTIEGTDPSTIKSITASLVNAPASARVTDVNGNDKTSLSSGDSVYVRMSTSEDNATFNIKFRADVDRKVGAIYEKKGQTVQDYVRIDTEPNTMEKELTIEWEKITTLGKIELIKVDQDEEPVVGAKFALKDFEGNVLGEVETGTDGKVMFYNVPVGDYILEEISAPEGYAIKDKSQNVTVVGGETTTVKFINERLTGKLVITKVDDANKPLANVTFEIYDEEGYVMDTITTDENGKASSKNLDYGTYYFKEISAPEGYIMDETLYRFKLDEENRTFYTTVTNERYKGSLLIVKTDEDNTPIKGVKFNILDENKEIITTIETNDKGLAGVQNLPLGTYYYQEIEAPDNVIIDNGVYEFKLETKDQIVRKDIVNEKVKGSLKITKVDDEDKVIAGVKFNVLDENKNVVDEIVTNENGIAVSKELTPGTYYYKEVEVPDGYVLDGEEHKFEITNDVTLVAVEVVNEKAKGSLQITKYDSNGSTLAGVEFDILDENKNVVDHIVTDENGKAESKKLPLGTYYYKETKAPDNVVMDEAEHQFVLNENNQVVQKTVVNEVKHGKLKIIKVDENNEPLAGVTFEILDKDMNVIDEMVTNEEGIAESIELEKGTYYYRETKAPEGIKVDSSLHEFTIEEDGQNVIENVINYYIKGQLKIYKLIDGTQTPLAGAVFEITDENGEVVDTITSDEEGIALSEKLPYGTYYFKEIEAPDGYIKDENTYQFKVENEDIIETVVYNTEEELPVTGGLISSNMTIVLMVALVSVVGYGLIRVLSAKKEN